MSDPYAPAHDQLPQLFASHPIRDEPEPADIFYDCLNHFPVLELENLKVDVELEESWICSSIRGLTAHLEQEEIRASNCLQRTYRLVTNLFNLAAAMSDTRFYLGVGFGKLLAFSEVVRVMERSHEDLENIEKLAPPIDTTQILKLCRHSLLNARLSTSQLLKVYNAYLA